MGNAAAIKGTDLTVSMTTGTKSAAARQVEQTDGGFQKLLNSKSEEDAGAKETADTKKDDKKEVIKDEAPEKPDAKEQEQPEETTAPIDSLEQVQAALLFQIQPEVPTAEAAPEEMTEMVTELGAIPAEEMPKTAEFMAEQPVQTAADETELPKEALQADVAPEQAVLPKEDKEEQPELGFDLAKPKETVKAEVKEETKAEVRAEQPLESVHPETQAAERTSVVKEVPTEHVKVSQPEEIPEKLLDQLLVKTTAGIKEFEIQLEPYDLGKIIIKAAFGKEHTSISIMCTEQKTMELMAKNARELGAIMEDNLGTPTTIVVEDKETGYLEQQNQNNDGSNANQNQDDSKKQGEKNQEKEGMDFLQQLRLGLI
ncbi:hypothetical protein [Candidatus Merdisoma sp. JLR.KK006]|uniref:hypothetical protein n=1 Tax=Candidatus Merdisoma sp. JLR.KK006 TaxID=3112626 RepID=UPI002FEF74C5